MSMEYKTFELEVKAAMDDGVIRGYASTFGNIDLGQDIVEQGAFTRTLKANKGVFPILADHNPSTQIGWNKSAVQDDKGLLVEGHLNLDTQLGKERLSLAKQAMDLGAKMGLSIGYSVIKQEPDKTNPAVRRLKEVKLYEYSMVTFPMNEMAMVTAAKSWLKAMQTGGKKQLAAELKTWIDENGLDLNEVIEELRRDSKSQDSLRLGHSMDSLIQKIKAAT